MATAKNGSRGAKSKQPSMEQLKTFVRTQGADYLQDPNITSVGIGYKSKDGKPTRELSIQFTVDRKVAPEALGLIDTTQIPESFVIDGIEVPTDVLQRSYEPAFQVISQIETNPRKVRIDPIVPGVSVGNFRRSAGTIGCIVYGQHDGTPYVLSNWHVLHGPTGSIGDDVVQPGFHDDNRVQRNRLGKLVRSHLGAAGDCAIATIEDRTFRAEILELGVPVEEIGEAELDDKVIKSGRTTGVTHGIVTRVNVIVSIDYGGNFDGQEIGGFEIGPDENHPPGDGEISMPGDSGSVWLFKSANGRPSRVLAGLHFAGEGSGNPNEHAVACYPKSVFEKLQVSLSTTPARTSAAVGEALFRRGYDPDFLGNHVNLPKLTVQGNRRAFKRDGSEVIPYTHFSLAQDMERRFAIWVAWNIDGGQLRRLSRNGIPFVLDPEVPAQHQVDDSLYGGNRLDRGHIARRADLLWGSDREARQANRDSFFFTNITPQMDDFNQSSQGGIWGRLEDAVFSDVDVEDLRVSVFGGPVFRDDDREFRGVKIPREFYKVLVFKEAGVLKSKAFLLTQNLDQLEALDLDEFRVFEVTLAEIEQRCDFVFPRELKTGDRFAELLDSNPESIADRSRKPIEALDQIRW